MVIIGLGNPGERYEATRHNAGYRVVDGLAATMGVRLARVWLRGYRMGSRTREGERHYLVKPLTFMNRSGDVLPDVLRRTSSGPAELLVVYDNVDLPAGSCRLRMGGGGGGGHRGLESVYRSLGTGGFMRVAVGIGRPAAGESLAEYVLDPPAGEEAEAFRGAVERAARAVLDLLERGPQAVMNELNRRNGSIPV